MLHGLKTDYKLNANYHQMYRAQERVKDLYLGGQRKNFHMIPSLLDRIKYKDIDSITGWSTRENSSIFEREFICPLATRKALSYLQPQVSLDACHTKNRKFPCQLFLATALDGNSKVFIFCFAIAPVENHVNWFWFCSLLRDSIEGVGDISIPLISDC
jgi:hypothetical protein